MNPVLENEITGSQITNDYEMPYVRKTEFENITNPVKYTHHANGSVRLRHSSSDGVELKAEQIDGIIVGKH